MRRRSSAAAGLLGLFLVAPVLRAQVAPAAWTYDPQAPRAQCPSMPSCGAWLDFRAAHQAPYQAFAIAPDESGVTVIISEPPPSLERAQLLDVLKALFGVDLLEVHAYRWPTGVDGWLEDLVLRVRAPEEAKATVIDGMTFEPWQAPAGVVDRLRFVHRLFYGTADGMWIDSLPAKAAGTESIRELRVPVSDLAGWLADPSKSWTAAAQPGVRKTTRELYDLTSPGVFQSGTGLIGLVIPGRVKTASVAADFRRFAVESDLLLGAVGLKNGGAMLVARQRQIPPGVLPPLRFESLQSFARNQADHVAQSYERQRIFAGRVSSGQYAGWDWAPILLSPQLDDSEFGTLLNLADQILKSWSQHGDVEYYSFVYSKPQAYPFGDLAASEYFEQKYRTSSLIFNWNTENLATLTTVNGREILTGDRTNALSILYRPSNWLGPRGGSFDPAQAQKDADAKAANARDYFATRGEPILVRVVQNVMLYQAVDSFLHVADPAMPAHTSRSDQVVGVLQKHAAFWLSRVLQGGAGVDAALVASLRSFMNSSGFSPDRMATVLASPQSVERELQREYQRLRTAASESAWMPKYLDNAAQQAHQLFVSTCNGLNGEMKRDLTGHNECEWDRTAHGGPEVAFASYMAYESGVEKMDTDYAARRSKLRDDEQQYIALQDAYEKAADIAQRLSKDASGVNLDLILRDVLEATGAAETHGAIRTPSVVLSKNTFDVWAIGGHNIDLTPARRVIAPNDSGLALSRPIGGAPVDRLAPPRAEVEALNLRRGGSLLDEMRAAAKRAEEQPEKWTELAAKAKTCDCDALVTQGENGVIYVLRTSPPPVREIIYGKSGVIDALAGPPAAGVVRFENFAPGTVEDIARSTSLASFGPGGGDGGWSPVARLFRGSEPPERATVISISRPGKQPELLRIYDESGGALLKEPVAWRSSTVEPATSTQWAQIYGASAKLDPASDAIIVRFGTAQNPRGALGIRVRVSRASRPGIIARLRAAVETWKMSRSVRPVPFGESLLELRDAIRRQLKPLELDFYYSKNKSKLRVAQREGGGMRASTGE